jgi:hypothetical protein
MQRTTRSAAQSFNQTIDNIGKPAFVAIETGDHRRQHFVRIQFLDFECLRIETSKMVCRLQIAEQLVRLSLDILGKAKRIAALTILTVRTSPAQ